MYVYRLSDKYAEKRRTDRQTVRHANRHTNRQAGRELDRHTDRLTDRHSKTGCYPRFPSCYLCSGLFNILLSFGMPIP